MLVFFAVVFHLLWPKFLVLRTSNNFLFFSPFFKNKPFIFSFPLYHLFFSFANKGLVNTRQTVFFKFFLWIRLPKFFRFFYSYSFPFFFELFNFTNTSKKKFMYILTLSFAYSLFYLCFFKNTSGSFFYFFFKIFLFYFNDFFFKQKRH